MATSHDTFSPDEFSETAAAAVANCAGRDVAECAHRLAEDGLLGVLANEDVGGLGLPLTYAVPVATQTGAGLLGFPLIETMLLARAFAPINAALSRSLVAGDQVATMAWRSALKIRREGAGLRLDGVADRAVLADRAQHVLVRLEDDSALLVPTATRGVTTSTGPSLALEAPEAVVTFDHAVIANGVVLTKAQFELLVRDALLLRSALILGSAETCISATVAHVSGRRQFGSTLVANQAVRHMLARHKLGLEGLRSAIDRCFLSSEPADLRVRSAFLFACDVGVKAAEGAIQLHGGMGFTWDMPMHRHLRQIRAQALLGGAEAVRDAIAADLIDPRNRANDHDDRP